MVKFGIRSPQQLSARRGTLVAFNALAAAAFSTVAIGSIGEHPSRDPFYLFLWFLWIAVTLLWVFGVPGWLRWSPAQRAVVNDELVRAHQASAAKVGMWGAVAALLILSLQSLGVLALPAAATPAALTAVVVATALYFAWLERADG